MLKDNIFLGIACGIITPIAVYVLLRGINAALALSDLRDAAGDVFQFSEKLIILLSITGNLIPFQFCKNKRLDNTMRGIVFPTVILVFWWAFKYSMLSLGS